jgi:hypothetical protein
MERRVAQAHGSDDMQVSDGYYTMDELYDHRITLYIALCSKLAKVGPLHEQVWRSRFHSDGGVCFGTGSQFGLGIGKEKGKQVTYHIPIERWDETEFAETLTLRLNGTGTRRRTFSNASRI